MEEQIRKAITEALAQMGVTGDTVFVVERPAVAEHGDYATNVALVVAKQLGRNPRELADELARALIDSLDGTIASHIVVAGPGFINITLSSEAVSSALADAESKEEKIDTKTRISIEYSNPNPFKEMHIGHLMSNVIGEAVARLIEASTGAHVLRDTFGGDVGPHVAKTLWALKKKGRSNPSVNEIGIAYTEGLNAYENDPQARAEIDALNQAIYAGVDKELMELWHKGRDVSMEEFHRLWKLLDTDFDFEFFDSDTTEIGLEKVNEGLTKGIFEKSDGAIIYRGEKKGLHTLVFITGHGTPTYETKDIGLAFLKQKKIGADFDYIVTAVEQVGHFKVVLAALEEIAPDLAKKTRHIPHGLLRLQEGKMSSRKGNIITATDLINDVIKRASEKNSDPHIAEQVAIGAIKYMVLRQAPGSDIIFDQEKSLSLEGDSGPYLQYALVRARSVLAQAKSTIIYDSAPASPYVIERIVLHFPEVAARAARELAPNLLVNYLTELAGAWNSFYAQERIIGGDYESHKLLVTRAFVQTMTNGLTLLGIPTPEKM